MTGVPSAELQAAIEQIAAADAVIAAAPVYKAGMSGLFKSFVDVLDNDLLIAKPVVLAATAGSSRHALVVDEQMRSLFAYMRALTLPTSVFAAPEDWAAAELGERVRRAATELAVVIQGQIEQGITELPSNTVIADCALTGHFCNEIHRGAIDGSLWFNTNEFINTPQQNIGVILTKGADLTAHYRLNIGGAGRLSFGLTGTYVRNFDVQPVPTLPAYDCSGLWGSTCGAPLPKWRHVLSTTWGTPWAGLDVTLRWRLIGKATVDRSSSDLLLAQAFYPYTAHIPNYNYIDLAAAIPIGRNVDFRLGVNNIADKNPPLILNGNFSDCPNTTCNDNTWVGTYDTLGRYIYAHLSAKF